MISSARFFGDVENSWDGQRQAAGIPDFWAFGTIPKSLSTYSGGNSTSAWRSLAEIRYWFLKRQNIELQRIGVIAEGD